MLQPISRPMHGLITDYPYVVLMAAAPATVGFKHTRTAARLCRVLSVGILLSSLLTRAEWGVVRVIPYKMHLAADVGVGILALSAPYLFGFTRNKRARTTFITAGVFGILAGLLSKPQEMSAATQPVASVE